jgi:hypothetical protein
MNLTTRHRRHENDLLAEKDFSNSITKMRPENLNNIGSFLNPIDIKIFEENSEYLKMKLNLKYFTAGIEKTILTVPKTSNLNQFASLLKDMFLMNDLKIEFFDLQRNLINPELGISELPQNNEFFVEVNGNLRTEMGHSENVK